MTTVYGSWVPNSTTNQRMRLHVTYTVPTPTVGQTSLHVTGTVYVDARYSFYDSSNTFTYGGTLIDPDGSTAVDINVATDGSDAIWTFDEVVALSSSSYTRTVSFSLTGVGYVGASETATVAATITIPAEVTDPPAAPTGFTVTRYADYRHLLEWSASGTISAFKIGRLRLGEAWTYRTVASGARSWNDYADLSNDTIRWAIRAENDSGASAWVYSDFVSTTPAAATGVTLVRSGSDAVASWTINAADADSQTLQLSTSADGGVTWSAWADLTGHVGFAAATTSRTITTLNAALQNKVRVVSTVTDPATLTAASEASAPLVLLTAPQAPTPLAPLGTVSTADDVELAWDHRPLDTTAQTAAEVAWSDDDWSTSTTETATTAETLTVTAGTWAPGPVKWRARTKGQHADWSPWSAEVSFTVADPPSVTIDSPTDLATWTSNKLTAAITFTDPAGASMVGWSAELATGGQTVESINGNTATGSISFAELLTDGEDYTATIYAVSGTGLTSAAATVTVTVDFVDPLPPSVDATWDEPTGTVALVVGFTAPTGSEAVTDHVRLERSDDAGQTWTIIADDLPDLAGIGDNRVPLNIDAQYRAVAVSALGVEAAGTVTVTTTTSKVWLINDSGVSVYVEHDLDMTTADTSDDLLITYLGDDYPTAHYGTALSDRVSVSGVWIDATGMAQRPSSLRGKPVWFRDPAGRAWWAAISGYDGSDPWDQLRGVSFTATRIQAPANG